MRVICWEERDAVQQCLLMEHCSFRETELWTENNLLGMPVNGVYAHLWRYLIAAFPGLQIGWALIKIG
jgi:hypothetical protein